VKAEIRVQTCWGRVACAGFWRVGAKLNKTQHACSGFCKRTLLPTFKGNHADCRVGGKGEAKQTSFHRGMHGTWQKIIKIIC